MANTYYQEYESMTSEIVRGMVDRAAIKASADIRNDGTSTGARLQMAITMSGDAWDYSDPNRNRAIQAFVNAVIDNPTVLTSMYPGGVFTPGAASATDLDFVVAGAWDTIAAALYPSIEP